MMLLMPAGLAHRSMTIRLPILMFNKKLPDGNNHFCRFHTDHSIEVPFTRPDQSIRRGKALPHVLFASGVPKLDEIVICLANRHVVSRRRYRFFTVKRPRRLRGEALESCWLPGYPANGGRREEVEDRNISQSGQRLRQLYGIP